MKIRHEINLLNRLVSSISGDLPELALVGSYSGDVFYGLEIVAKLSAAGTGYVYLHDGGDTVLAEIAVVTTSYIRYRARMDQAGGLVHLNVGSTDITILSAKVVAVQDTGSDAIIASESQLEIGDYAAAVFNSAGTDPLANPKYWYYDSAKWAGPIVTFSAQVCWSCEDAKYWLTVILQEDDGSFGSWATKVTIVNQGGNESVSISSIEFTPTSGRNYRIVYSTEGTKASYGANIYSAKIVVNQHKDIPDSKLANPSTLPGINIDECSITADGVYYAGSSYDTPYLVLYKRSGDTLTKLTNPSTMPQGSSLGCSFTRDGLYLAVAHYLTPFITIYSRSGDTFTKITNPSSLPANDGRSCAFSGDTNYLVVAHVATPYLTVYSRSGSTFTKLADPSSLPANIGSSAAISYDGTYIAVGSTSSPYLDIYKRTGTTLTALTLADEPLNIGASLAMTDDGVYLAVTFNATPYLYIYKRTGDTFSLIASPTLSGFGATCSFSPDGRYLTIGLSASPYMIIYRRSGDTFSSITNPAVVPAGQTNGCAFAADGGFLAMGFDGSPYMIVYKDDNAVQEVTKLEEHYLLENTGQTGTGFQEFMQLYSGDEWDGVTVDMFPEHDASGASSNTYLSLDPYSAQMSNSNITGANRKRGATALPAPNAGWDKLSDPASIPTSYQNDCATSDNDVYLAMVGGSTASEPVIVYKKSGNEYTKLSALPDQPAAVGNGCALTADGVYLAVALSSSPYLRIWKRSGDTFTKLTDPSTMPPNLGQSCDFSPDGNYLCVGHSNSPYITIYSRSGDTFTKITDPSDLPSSTGYGCGYSNSGDYLAVGHALGDLIVYEVSGSTYTKVTGITTPTGDGRGCSWTPKDDYLAVAHSTSPYITIYSVADGVFTKLSNPATLPPATGYACAFSRLGKYLAVAHDVSPYVTVYARSGDTFTKMDDPTTLPASHARGVEFLNTLDMLSVSHQNTPFMTTYTADYEIDSNIVTA